MPRLLSTVYVKDPTSHEWVICEAGTEPEPHLAQLIRTPSAWENGEVPEPDPADTPAAPDPGAGGGGQEPAAQEPAEPEPKPENKPRTRRTTAKAEE
ncbi:hypothetical protein HUT19_41860 (plasmid) [Streptomyces sp. NA02950]|uniref:hypothetical protein n=1 Tax=Streptomyces sp. NA02950 TaxID=2742137 RepID=UPI001591C5DC|nr:hypothetical protein [Streptomyces sp. NA02950]QKV98266.1 hypothetical protein HUT19_41860 [Streptomyces sp. NA02950]